MKSMMGKILERYELSNIIIEIVKSRHGYDIIYIRDNNTGYFMRNVPLCDAYAFVAGYMYNRARIGLYV